MTKSIKNQGKNVDDDQIESSKSNKSSNRFFSANQKDSVWRDAPSIPGRDPKRWRYDALGNPVIYVSRSNNGAISHSYDHIQPFSKGGQTTIANC